MKLASLLFLAAGGASAALPAVGPDYSRPSTAAPNAWRDADNPDVWKVAVPADAFARGEWWKVFSDPALDELEGRVQIANQDLRAAAARVEQSRAAAGLARGAYWPQIAADASVVRERTSATTENKFPEPQTTTYRIPLLAAWEIDLFGRVRRLNESARAEANASAAAFETIRLALTADVAVNYFSLRAVDRELALLHDTVALRRRALDLVNARVASGTAADFDTARAETELATAEAETAALAKRQAALQNALAVLVGEPAGSLVLPAMTFVPTPPSIPAGLPSELLERRPDVAAAERSLAAANARIGVAKAAFFPAISLTGGAGYASGEIDRLFDAGSRLWSIGPRLYLPIFQGGRNRANLKRSRAAYDEAVANFRQQVLIAFREVQDALTATRLLAEQGAAQDRALASAKRAAGLAQVRYDAGLVSYLEVIDVQRTALATERAAVQLAAQRVNTSVALIKSLGGGWHNSLAGPAVARR
jgi:multidrug efflux system outer membrane protein